MGSLTILACEEAMKWPEATALIVMMVAFFAWVGWMCR